MISCKLKVLVDYLMTNRQYLQIGLLLEKIYYIPQTQI